MKFDRLPQLGLLHKKPEGEGAGDVSGADETAPTAEEQWIEAHKNDPDFDPEEFKFHQDRFKHMAKKHSQRGIVKRILDLNAEKDAMSFAHEEALRDNEEWNKMYRLEVQNNGELRRELQAEYKEWHEMLKQVLSDLKIIRDNPESKEAKEMRPLVLVLGGGMAGSYGAGQVAALVHTGYLGTFKQSVGISAGACDLAYALAGRDQVLAGSSMYYQDCAKKEFLNFGRPTQIMNVGFLADIMEHGEERRGEGKKLDTKAIEENPTEFFVQATNRKTLKSEFIDAKHNDQGIIPAVHASMALPWFYRKSVKINGEDWVDGAFESFPLEEVIKKFNPTHILVLPQVPYENMVAVEQEARLSRAIASIMPFRGSLAFGTTALAEKMIKSREGFRKGLKRIQEEKGIKIGIMYPPNQGLSPITNDPDAVKAGILAAAKKACEDLGEKMDFTLKK